MTRYFVLGLSLMGVLGAGTATVLAHHTAPTKANANELCIVFAKDANHHNTQDYCINWSTVPLH